MKENIKIGLLGIITLTVVINTFFMDDSPQRRSREKMEAPQSNIVATPNQISTPLNTTPTPKKETLSDSRAKTSIEFAENKHDFGTIEQDTKNTKVFKFTNTGSEPLIIEDAKGTCGCTVPTYPKEPIAPGATGEIEVVYSPGKQKGKQGKTITITANTNPVSSRLTISADVEVVK